MTFGRIFINSLYDKVDMTKVNSVFILDIGLKEEDKKYFHKGKGVYDVNLEEHTKWSKEFKKWKKGNIEKV